MRGLEAVTGQLRAAVPAPIRRMNRVHRFGRNLRLFNDVLADTPMAGRYWVIGGLLIGWAREGRLLSFDARDADFGFWEDDLPLLEGCVETLGRRGFSLSGTYIGTRGTIAEHSFSRQGVRFDFLSMRRIGDEIHYCGFGPEDGSWWEIESTVPYQKTVPFDFLGRTWQKMADHELALDVAYGDWRVPDPDWDYLHAPNIVARRSWTPERPAGAGSEWGSGTKAPTQAVDGG
ncbi:MAG: hypothetical protein ACYCVN_01505 [Acidimicrobiales bacterium]